MICGWRKISKYQSVCVLCRTYLVQTCTGGPLKVVRSTGDRQDRPSNTRQGLKKCGVDCWVMNRKNTRTDYASTIMSPRWSHWYYLYFFFTINNFCSQTDKALARVPTPKLCALEEKSSITTLAKLPCLLRTTTFSSQANNRNGAPFNWSRSRMGLESTHYFFFLFKRLGKWKRLFRRQKRFPVKKNAARSDMIHLR